MSRNIRVTDVYIVPAGSLGGVSEAKLRLSCLALFRGTFELNSREIPRRPRINYGEIDAAFIPSRGGSVRIFVSFDYLNPTDGLLVYLYLLPVGGHRIISI